MMKIGHQLPVPRKKQMVSVILYRHYPHLEPEVLLTAVQKRDSPITINTETQTRDRRYVRLEAACDSLWCEKENKRTLFVEPSKQSVRPITIFPEKNVSLAI